MGNWTEQQVANLGQPAPKPVRVPARMRGPNKTESAYGVHLQLLCHTGENRERVTWFAYEAVKIRIGVNCWFTPDYLVQYADGHLELHDCKGTKDDHYRAEEDAIVKARSVGAHFPLPIFFVWKLRNGEWRKQRM